jgi:hypothetical protein
VKVFSQLKQREMKKISAILTQAVSANQNWHTNQNKFAQAFTSLTGYEFMLEKSRADIEVAQPSKLALLRASFTNLMAHQLPSAKRE